MARKKKSKSKKVVVVKVYVNQVPVAEAGTSESPISIAPLVKGGLLKPHNIMSGGAILVTIASLVAHFFGKM